MYSVTATALDVLTVRADDKTMVQHFVVWLLLHRDGGFVPSRVERLHLVVLQFDLKLFIEFQDRCVRVAVFNASCLPVRKRCLSVRLLLLLKSPSMIS